tara:strand:- start:9345 stop:10328 length:984 start_codon:yes stop_codon:yes gene_type:complete
LKNKVKIIAEAGLNHNGDFKKLIKLIDIAKSVDADYVKFQLFTTENFINQKFNHKKINYKKLYQRFKSLEFSLEKWKKAIKHADSIGIKIFFSVFDKESCDILKKLKISLIKIPSGEINNYDLLKKINKSGKKVILSTGMSNLFEIQKALKHLNKCKVILMHCVSEYPTLKPNLNNIKLLQKKFKLEVGYSDHTPDVITPALSVIAGASYVEKHFTYNKKQKLGDHKFSLNPGELRIMMKNVRLAEASKGEERKTISPKEKKLQFFARKGLYLIKDKLKGEKIKHSDLIALRPQGYLSVDKMNIIKNKKLKIDLRNLEPLKLNYFRR